MCDVKRVWNSAAEEFARAVEHGGPVRPALLPLLAVVRGLEALREATPTPRRLDGLIADIIAAARSCTESGCGDGEVIFSPAGNPVSHGGSGSGYTNYGCRCEDCTEANTARMHRRRLERKGKKPPSDAHGQLSTYVNWWCRCPACRRAASAARA